MVTYAACNKLCQLITNVQTAPLEGYTVVPGEENRTAGGAEGFINLPYFPLLVKTYVSITYRFAFSFGFLSHIFKLKYNSYTIVCL